MTFYDIHDNGSRPFRVVIDNVSTNVKIYRLHWNGVNDIPEEYPCYENNVEGVFIGKSHLTTMTAYSGGYGEEFDGNTILLDLGSKQYVFVGQKIEKFQSIEPIVSFVSLLGDKDVPYPYATDTSGNIYLLVEEVILLPQEEIQEYEDPYNFYYENCENFDIDEICGSGGVCTFKYFPFPEMEYDLLQKIYGDELTYFDMNKGVDEQMTKELYVELLNDYGNKNGLRPLLMEEIQL